MAIPFTSRAIVESASLSVLKSGFNAKQANLLRIKLGVHRVGEPLHFYL